MTRAERRRQKRDQMKSESQEIYSTSTLAQTEEHVIDFINSYFGIHASDSKNPVEVDADKGLELSAAMLRLSIEMMHESAGKRYAIYTLIGAANALAEQDFEEGFEED